MSHQTNGSAPSLTVRALGWAGIQLDAGGYRLVVDAFAEPGIFEPFMSGPDPRLLAPDGPVDAALVTHLHRDHTDPATLVRALRPGAPLLAPAEAAGEGHEGAAIGERELADAGLAATRVEPGFSTELGPFTVTAVEAADGLGDPQVSWVIATDSVRLIHGGDTVWHGAWWRIARDHGPFDAAFLPANGARVDFPWMQPPAEVPAAMTPEQAVEAARALGARRLIAIHHGALEHERFYRPLPDVPEAVAAAAAAAGIAGSAARAGDRFTW